MTKEYCPYESMDEMEAELSSLTQKEVYNHPALYYNVFQDDNVLKASEELLVAIVRHNSGECVAVLEKLYDMIDKLKVDKVLPMWEDVKRNEALQELAEMKMEELNHD